MIPGKWGACPGRRRIGAAASPQPAEGESRQAPRVQKAELDVRRERQRLEDEKTAFELNFTRRLDEERALVREQAKREASEERRFEDARKDKKIEDLTRKISELEQLAASGGPATLARRPSPRSKKTCGMSFRMT